jgi:hypothetical protein
VNPEIKAFPPIDFVNQEEKRAPEQGGLKELCPNIQIAFAKKGGREPGVRKWGG